MNTDDLLRALAADTAPAPPLRSTLVLALTAAVALAALAVWAVLGLRTDLITSLAEPLSIARFLWTGALGLIGVQLALTLARPEGGAEARLWPLGVVAAAVIALFVYAVITTPADARQMALVGKTISVCLVSIPLLSVLTVGAVLMMLRRGATTAPRLASAIAGLAGGGIAAAVYALHCTEDSPMFYVTWYGLAILIVTLVSMLIGPRLLRW